jgi:succinylarginine dihydrolase
MGQENLNPVWRLSGQGKQVLNSVMFSALALAAAVATASPPVHARAEAVARVTIIRATRIDFSTLSTAGQPAPRQTKSGLTLIEFQ